MFRVIAWVFRVTAWVVVTLYTLAGAQMLFSDQWETFTLGAFLAGTGVLWMIVARVRPSPPRA